MVDLSNCMHVVKRPVGEFSKYSKSVSVYWIYSTQAAKPIWSGFATARFSLRFDPWENASELV